MLAMDEKCHGGEDFWRKQSYSAQQRKNPNPTFHPPSDSTALLHYGTNPLLAFHLATAYASLSESSPMHPKLCVDKNASNLVQAAQSQFVAWTAAFRKRASRQLITICAFAGDALSFAYAIQCARNAPHSTPKSWYKDSFCAKPIVLNYDASESPPTLFDVIDTSNLVDHLEYLNVAIACIPLLRQMPHSTLLTENILRPDQSVLDHEILQADFVTMSHLLGIFPIAYWTHGTVCFPEDEMFQVVLKSTLEKHAARHAPLRITWKLRPSVLAGMNASLLTYDADVLSKLLHGVYLNMFKDEDLGRQFSQLLRGPPSFVHESLCKYNRASFAALCTFLKNSVSTHWDGAIEKLLRLIENDRRLLLGPNHFQELHVYLHLHNLYSSTLVTEPTALTSSRESPASLFGWNDAPGVVRLTLVVPRTSLAVFNTTIGKRSNGGTPNVHCTLDGPRRSSCNIFSAVNLSFGTVSGHGQRHTSNFTLNVDEDERGWNGDSPLVVSFWAPTATLMWEQDTAKVSFSLRSTPSTLFFYGKKLGIELKIFETNLNDFEHVFLTTHPPHLDAASLAVCSSLSDRATPKFDEGAFSMTTTAILDKTSKVSALHCRLTIQSSSTLAMLRENAPVDIERVNPFVTKVKIGEKEEGVEHHISLPIPTDTARSKLRVSRISGYLELHAPLLNLQKSHLAADLFVIKNMDNGLPTIWGMPRLRLDGLPVLKLRKKQEKQWFITHTSLMWTSRERRIRQAYIEGNNCPDSKVNFKESLFSMMMRFMGIQGGQVNVFGLSHQSRDGSIDTLIFPQQLRLDASNRSVVLDAFIVPLSEQFARTVMDRFMKASDLLRDGGRGICNIFINDEEGRVWKHMIPAFVERCRTWSHKAHCEYRISGTIPLSTEYAAVPICSCGMGLFDRQDTAHIPGFGIIAKYAVRAAISPYFGSSMVETLCDESPFDMNAPTDEPPENSSTPHGCGFCNSVANENGGPLLECARCRTARYCSKACQKKAWAQHKLICRYF